MNNPSEADIHTRLESQRSQVDRAVDFDHQALVGTYSIPGRKLHGLRLSLLDICGLEPADEQLQLRESEIITGPEAVLDPALRCHLAVFSGDLQLDLGLGIRQRDQGQPALFTIEAPLGPLHAGLQEPAGIHLEGVPESLLANELRLALPCLTEASPGALELPVAFGLERDLRAGDDLHLSGRIRDLRLAEPCVPGSQDPQNRGDDLRPIVNFDPGRSAVVITAEKIKFELVEDAWDTVAERRRPEFFSGSWAALFHRRGHGPAPLPGNSRHQPAPAAAEPCIDDDKDIPGSARHPAAQIEAGLARVVLNGLGALEEEMRFPRPVNL